MATCANCASDAIYTYQVTEDFGIHYCQRHLPRFLNGHKITGELALKQETQPEVEAEEPKPSKKKTAPVAEETPVVEETPAEEAPAGE